MTPVGEQAWQVAWILAAVGWGACAAAWARGRADDRPLLAGAVLGVVALGAAWGWTVHPDTLSPASITALQEGTTLDVVRNLGRVDAHAGPAWHALLRLFTPDRLDLRAVAAHNTLFTDLAILGAAVAAGRLTRSPLVGTVAGVVLTLDPITASHRYSEQPGPVLACALLAALLPWALWRDAARTRLVRGIGLLTLGILTACMAAVRVEIATVASAALALGLLHDLFPRPVTAAAAWADRTALGLRTGNRAAWAGLGTVALAWIVGAVVSWTPQGHGPLHPWPRPLGQRLGVADHLSWAVEALDPWQASWIQLPWLLPGLLPPAAALLVLVGLGVGLRHPLKTGGAALSVLWLFRTFIAASHDSLYEMIRYLGPLVPIWAVLGAVGWRALRPLGPRVQTGVAVSLLIPAVPWFAITAIPWPGTPDALGRAQPVDRALQAEARMFLEVAQEHGHCMLLTRSRRWTGRPVNLPPGTDPDAPINLGTGVLLWPRAEERTDLIGFSLPDDLIRGGHATFPDLVRRASCIRMVEGRTCNGPDAPTCAEDTRGATLVASWSLPLRPYNHPKHPQPTADPLVFRVWDLPPEAAVARFSRGTPPTPP